MSDPGASPQHLLPAPPQLPEAEQLASFTQGVQQVRSMLRRETFGVVLPINQLGALDHIIAEHEKSVATLRATAKSAQGGVINLADALVLLDSLVAQVGAAADWLEVARSCPRLPRFDERGPLLSTQRSKDRRGGVLAFIDRYIREATELIRELKAVSQVPSNADPAAVDLFLGGYEVELACLRALALTSATGAVASAIEVPPTVLEQLLARLHSVIRWSRFGELSSALKSSVLTAIARLAADLRHSDIVRTALAKAFEFPSANTDAALQSIRNLLTVADTPGQRLDLAERLAGFAQSLIGSPFSRERLGRLSVLCDTFQHLICTADETTADGRWTITIALSAYYQWAYGTTPAADGVIYLVTDWQGAGRAIWQGTNGLEVRRFTIPVEAAIRVFQMSERRAGSKTILAASDAILSTALAPVLEELPDVPKDWSIGAIGVIGVLPVMGTPIHGEAIGATERFTHLHPLHGSSLEYDLAGKTPDLLLLDLCFEERSREVELAFRSANHELGTRGRVLTFDSRAQGRGVDQGEMLTALQSARWPIYFGHAFVPATRAAAAGLVLGDSELLAIEELANLDLSHLDGFVLIGCASGRYSPILGGVSVAHAVALAGAREVVFSSWPLMASQGSRFAEALLRGYAVGARTAGTMADYFRADASSVGLFGMMRP